MTSFVRQQSLIFPRKGSVYMSRYNWNSDIRYKDNKILITDTGTPPPPKKGGGASIETTACSKCWDSWLEISRITAPACN